MCKWDLLNTGMDETKPIDLEKKKNNNKYSASGPEIITFLFNLGKTIITFLFNLGKTIIDTYMSWNNV
jgi:hypothetical protein